MCYSNTGDGGQRERENDRQRPGREIETSGEFSVQINNRLINNAAAKKNGFPHAKEIEPRFDGFA